MAEHAQTLVPARPQVHDCWNRTGVRGDRSCSELAQYAHCRNCPAYSTAARKLLDAPLPVDHEEFWTNHYARPVPAREAQTRAALVFRVSGEWLALPANACVEITEMRRIHTVPHRRNQTLLGIVNIRGTLLPCAELAVLLSLSSEPESTAAMPRARLQRLVVLSGTAGPVAIRADEVEGVHRFDSNDLKRPPATVANGKVTYTKGVLARSDKVIALLDHELLYATIGRSLA